MVTQPVLLDRIHDVSSFDCGKPALNQFLHQFALSNQASGSARTYVALDETAVAGYYSLAPVSVEHRDAPDRVIKGQARYPVPCLLLARLAVALSHQGIGLGRSLFRDALLRAYQGHQLIGGRAFLVHAKDEEAAAFYGKFDMIPSPTDPLHLYLLFKHIRSLIGDG